MTTMISDNTTVKPWKRYTKLVIEAMIAFYLATFSLVIYFYHREVSNLATDLFMSFLYLFILGLSIKRLIQQLPLAVLMILVPIAPLYALIVIVTMIPIIQLLH